MSQLEKSTRGDSSNETNECMEFSRDEGLLIQLHDDATVTIKAVTDKHYPTIHPNCYAPANLTDVKLLHGGGSGTAVFGGHHSTMGNIVMKHGGVKDSKEVLALATITAELLARQTNNHRHAADKLDILRKAADDMRSRIPEFVMLYISPFHLRDREMEEWHSLRKISYTKSGQRMAVLSERNTTASMSSENLKAKDRVAQEWKNAIPKQTSCFGRANERFASRSIRVKTGNFLNVEWFVNFTSVDIEIPRPVELNRHGIDFLGKFGKELMEQQSCHDWKVTLAQRAIGGPKAMNGADVLLSGWLHGSLLDKLISEVCRIIEDLDLLTLPDERSGCHEQVLQQTVILRETDDIDQISELVDRFVGKSIIKNFHPKHGRLHNLRLLGEEFRKGDYCLTSLESSPATFLGILLQRGVSPDTVFEKSPAKRTALDIVEENGWLGLLQQATNFDKVDCVGATDCLWTCGLTDAGLHNTFLCEERGLEVFDLGEPGLEPRPAFLTKFLMSFWHIVGMEHDGATWKTRFRVVDTKSGCRLSLTSETADKIPYIHRVFSVTVDRLIQNLFGGNKQVRKLLYNYVVLQLLSDASFCLQRWEAKGGGTERCGDRKDYPMQQWLWRSLWDQYIACYVQSEFVENQCYLRNSN